jgi:uncharacterized protein (UPF0335 family)
MSPEPKAAPPVPEIVLSSQPTKSQPKKGNPSRSNIEFKVNAMKVVELKKELKSRGFDTNGLKKDLRTRLLDVMMEELDGPSIAVSPVTLDKPDCVQKVIKEDENDQQMEENFAGDVASENEMQIKGVEKSENLVETRKETRNESVSSMKVEHHSLSKESVRKESPKSPLDPLKVLKENSPKRESQVSDYSNSIPSTANGANDSSIKEKIHSLSNAKVVSVDSFKRPINEANQAIASTELREHIPMKVDNLNKISSTDEDDISPPASEASSVSKASGKMVKDMVSKFSGFSSISSTSSGSSALSKGLQAKKEARMAKMAEIREKVRPHACHLNLWPFRHSW